LDSEEIRSFCEAHHISKLSLFGSILTDRFRADSDVDILVEFEPGHTPGFLRMAALEALLSEMINRKVDLRTPAELSRYFRDEVVAASDIQYAG
jgi:predicted nucleotidyltransferase